MNEEMRNYHKPNKDVMNYAKGNVNVSAQKIMVINTMKKTMFPLLDSWVDASFIRQGKKINYQTAMINFYDCIKAHI